MADTRDQAHPAARSRQLEPSNALRELTRTRILEGVSTAFSQQNRARAVWQGRKKELSVREGKAEFGAALVDVVTDGEFLDPGSRVRVTMVEGDRVVVEGLDGAHGGSLAA